MKYLKWLLFLPIAGFPYVLFLVLYGHGDFWGALSVTWLTGLICALVVLFVRRLWSVQALSLTAMIVKLLQIPAYVMWFLFAMVAFLFGGPVIAFFFDVLTIILSGLLGLAGVLRTREEGKLTTPQAVGYGILQFIFCVDIVSAILVYCASRKHKEETL